MHVFDTHEMGGWYGQILPRRGDCAMVVVRVKYWNMKVEYFANKRVTKRYLIGILIFPGLTMWLLTCSPDVRVNGLPAHVVGWIFVLVSAWFFGIFPWSYLLQPGLQVIIDEQGIEDRGGGLGMMQWEEIASVFMKKVGRSNRPPCILCLELRHSKDRMRSLKLFKRLVLIPQLLFGLPCTTINFAFLTPDPAQAWENIVQIIQDRASEGKIAPKLK